MIYVRAAVAVATGVVVMAPAAYMRLRQIETGIRSPESFWPTTMVGWLGAFLSIVAVVGVVYSLHRFSQKPVMEMIGELKRQLKELQEHYDDRLLEVQEHFDAEVERVLEMQTREINGWSGRITDNTQRIDAQRVILDGILLEAREARTNQEHIKGTVDRISAYLLGGLEAVQRMPPPPPPKRDR